MLGIIAIIALIRLQTLICEGDHFQLVLINHWLDWAFVNDANRGKEISLFPRPLCSPCFHFFNYFFPTCYSLPIPLTPVLLFIFFTPQFLSSSALSPHKCPNSSPSRLSWWGVPEEALPWPHGQLQPSGETCPERLCPHCGGSWSHTAANHWCGKDVCMWGWGFLLCWRVQRMLEDRVKGLRVCVEFIWEINAVNKTS